MPAAVPLTAAITGFSQSRTAAIRRWAPRRIIRATSPGDALARAPPDGAAQVGARAEALAGRGDDDRPDAGVGGGLSEQAR